jgi:hypothetical protein
MGETLTWVAGSKDKLARFQLARLQAASDEKQLIFGQVLQLRGHLPLAIPSILTLPPLDLECRHSSIGASSCCHCKKKGRLKESTFGVLKIQYRYE